MDRKNSLITALTYETDYLKKKLKSQERTSRKAVNYDLNKRFAQIPEIAAAHFKASQAAQRYLSHHARNLEDELFKLSLENMKFDFQV